VAAGTVFAGEQLARAVTRTWWPLALPAAVLSRRGRIAVAGALIAPPLLDWLRTRPRTDPVRFTVAHLVDDLAYGTGVWEGCFEKRTFAPLLPQFAWKVRGAARRDAASPLRDRETSCRS